MCEATNYTPAELFDRPREEFWGLFAAVTERNQREKREADAVERQAKQGP